MKTSRILFAMTIAFAAFAACTRFDPVFPDYPGHSSGGNYGGGSGNNNGGGQPAVTQPQRQSAWKIEYKGRSVYTDDGSKDTVEGFDLTYTGSEFYIIRTVEAGSVKDLAAFFKEQADALADNFSEDENNVFKDSRLVYFDLMIHGNYDVYMIEISSKKKATMSYQLASIEVKEGEASADYLSWIGRWKVTDGYVGYDIDIVHAENDLLYEVWGWESGPGAGTQDMGDDWLFVRYDSVEKGLAFYIQSIGPDDEEGGDEFDKVFVGTWMESGGEVVDAWEGAVVARSGENEKGELALIPETVEFKNGATPTYMTMRYSSRRVKDELWFHYNASVPSLYKMQNKVMTYPLTMTRISQQNAAPRHSDFSPDKRDRRFKAKVHVPLNRRRLK